MRYRPTPSAPRSRQCAASWASSMLPSRRIAHAVERDGRLVAQRLVAVGPRADRGPLLFVAGDRGLVRVDDEHAFLAVHDHRVAAGHVGEEPAEADDGGDLQRAGEDGGVAGVAAALGGEGEDRRGREVGRVRRHQVVGEDDDRLGEFLKRFGVLAEERGRGLASRCR